MRPTSFVSESMSPSDAITNRLGGSAAMRVSSLLRATVSSSGRLFTMGPPPPAPLMGPNPPRGGPKVGLWDEPLPFVESALAGLSLFSPLNAHAPVRSGRGFFSRALDTAAARTIASTTAERRQNRLVTDHLRTRTRECQAGTRLAPG